MKAYRERTVRESDLDKYYKRNGFVVSGLEEAKDALQVQGYILAGDVYKNKFGCVARIYKLRNADLNYDGSVGRYVPAGYLVSFGGNHKSCVELKFSKVPRYL